MGDVKLFRSWSSPFALRIVWELNLKGIEYETILEDMSNKSPLLLQYNPIYKKIPVLVHKGKPIPESLIILEYIEDTWNQLPLLPQDPYERARARFWAKFGDDQVFPSVWGACLKLGKAREEAMAAAIENLKFLEEELRGKKYFGGESIGFVDISFGWLAYIVNVLEQIIGIKLITEERFPLLLAWIKEFSDVPIIKESWPDRDRLVTKFCTMREAYLAANTT